MISNNVDHLEQAIRASAEADRRQANRPEGWDDRPYIPAHLADQQGPSTPEGAPLEEVQGDILQSPLSPTTTHGGETREQANSIMVDIEDIEADATSIVTL